METCWSCRGSGWDHDGVNRRPKEQREEITRLRTENERLTAECEELRAGNVSDELLEKAINGLRYVEPLASSDLVDVRMARRAVREARNGVS